LAARMDREQGGRSGERSLPASTKSSRSQISHAHAANRAYAGRPRPPRVGAARATRHPKIKAA
jgi:hypothetical protein